MLTQPRRSGRNLIKRRGLGIVATPVGGSMVYSSSPIPQRSTGSRFPAVGPSPFVPVSIGVKGPVGINPVPVGPVIGPMRWRNPSGGSGVVSTSPNWPSPVWGGSPGSSNGSGGGWQGRTGSNWQSGQGGGGWGGGGSSSPWSPASSPYGSTPQNPNNSQALAAAQALLATNPSLLTPQQFQMLQQAGLVSNTLPYSSVSNINPTTPLTGSTAATASVNDPNCVAAGCTGGPYPNCTCAAATDETSSLDADVEGLPLYGWLIIGGVGLYLLTRRR
jgi:hypothetical protein